MLKSVLCVVLVAVLANTQPTCPADSSCLCSTDVHLIFGSSDASFITFGENLAQALLRSDSNVQIGIYGCEFGVANLLSDFLNRDYSGDLGPAINGASSFADSIDDCPVSTLSPGGGSRQVVIYILPTGRFGNGFSTLGDMTSATGQQFEVFVSFPVDEGEPITIGFLDAWLRAVPRDNFIYFDNFARNYPRSLMEFGVSFSEPLAQSLTASAALGATSIACSLFGAATSIVTFDGVPYNFQGHGEYWLSYARSSDLDGVQVRLEPCLEPTGDQQTTCATAFAISSDSNILEIERVGSTNRLTLRYNGELQEPLTAVMAFNGFQVSIVELLGTSGEKERDRLVISTAAARYEIQFMDVGALFWTIPVFNARGSVEGLCGNYNGCRLDEFMTADREGFGVVNDAEQQYRAGESYRVTEADTLFTHRPSQRYPARSSFSPLTAALADQNAIAAAGCESFGEAFESACSFQLAVDPSSPHLFTAYWEACTLFCSLGVSFHGYLDEYICNPVCSPTPPLRDSVPFCSVVENDLGGECEEYINIAAGEFGFTLTAPSSSYLQYLGLSFNPNLDSVGWENVCNLALFGSGMRDFPRSPGFNNAIAGDGADDLLAPYWSSDCSSDCGRRCIDNEVYLPTFDWNLDTVGRGSDCDNFNETERVNPVSALRCSFDAPFVTESAFDARDFARSTIERPNDASALFYPSSNRGGIYELKLSVITSCGTSTRDVDINVMCKNPIFTVDAGANQTVGVTPLGYAEIQMSATAMDGSTPIDQVAASDGRNVQMSWVFTQLPMSVFRGTRYSNGLDDLAFTRESLGIVLLDNFAVPEIVYMFDQNGVSLDLQFPLDEANVALLQELIPLAAPRLFDAVSPAIRGAQSTLMRWQPPTYGTYRLAFQVDDGCRVVSDEVEVETLCPDCRPVAFIIGSEVPNGNLQGLDQFEPRVQVPGVNWQVDTVDFSDLEFDGMRGVDGAAGADHAVDLSWSLSVIEMLSDNVTYQREVIPLSSHSILIYEQFMEQEVGSSGLSTDNVGPSRFVAPHIPSCDASTLAVCEDATTAAAVARCCSPGQCVSVCYTDPPTLVTYDQALAQCKNIGMQLCTLEELTGGVTAPAASSIEYNAGSCCTADAVNANANDPGGCGTSPVWVLDPNAELCSGATVQISRDDDGFFTFSDSLPSTGEPSEPSFPVSINNPPFEFLHVGRIFAYTRSIAIEQDWTVELGLQNTNNAACEIRLEETVAANTNFGDDFDTAIGTSTSFYDIHVDDSVDLNVISHATPAQCQGTYRVSLNAWNQCEARTDFIDVDVTCGPPPVAIINALSSTQYNYDVAPTSFDANLVVSGIMSYPGGFVEDVAATVTGLLSYDWSCEGPGTCGFVDDEASNTGFSISGPVAGGMYTVSLTVDDGCQQSTTTREVQAQCGDVPQIVIDNVANLEYDGLTFPTNGDPIQGEVRATSAQVNGVPQIFSYTITPPALTGISEEVLAAQNLFTVEDVVNISENSAVIQLGQLPALQRGGTYDVAATVSDGCQSATATTTLDVICPRTFEISPETEQFSLGEDGGRVYLDFELSNIQCNDADVCTGDTYTVTNYRVLYSWAFVSWPGQDEGADPPPFGEGSVVSLATVPTDIYDAFGNPAGTVWFNDQASFRFNTNGCPIESGVNPLACTSFVPRRPGTYELALVVYDGCHFAATPEGSYFQVVVDACDNDIDEPLIDDNDVGSPVGVPVDLLATPAVSPDNSDFVTFKWVVISAPEHSSCKVDRMNDFDCQALFTRIVNEPVGSSIPFTPDVEGVFEIQFIEDHYICGEKRSEIITVTAACVNGLVVPSALSGTDSQWLPRLSGETTSTGHFPLATVQADGGGESHEYWWTIIAAPDNSIYEPQCYDGNSNRNQPDDACPQFQEESQFRSLESIPLDFEGNLSDAAPHVRSRFVPDAQANINVPIGHTATVGLTTRTTMTYAYQSYAKLAAPQDSDEDRENYRGFFFPDLPGVYELELRVLAETCNYGIAGTTTVTATCSGVSVIGQPTQRSLPGTQGRYELDASTFVDVDSDENLVFWWDWLPPQYDSAEQLEIIFQEMVYLNTPIYNNDAPIASFRPSMAGRYQARVMVTNGCDLVEAILTVDHSCETAGGSANVTTQQINLIQISEGAAGVSEMLVDLEPLVPDFCAESYKWEVTNYNPEFDDLVDDDTTVSGARGRFGFGVFTRVMVAIFAFSMMAFHMCD